MALSPNHEACREWICLVKQLESILGVIADVPHTIGMSSLASSSRCLTAALSLPGDGGAYQTGNWQAEAGA